MTTHRRRDLATGTAVALAIAGLALFHSPRGDETRVEETIAAPVAAAPAQTPDIAPQASRKPVSKAGTSVPEWIDFDVKQAPISISDYDGVHGEIVLDPVALATLAVGDTVQVTIGNDTLHYVAAVRRDDEHGTYVGLGSVDAKAGVETSYYSSYYLYPDGTGRVGLNSEVAAFDAMLGSDGRGKFSNQYALRKQYEQKHGPLPALDY